MSKERLKEKEKNQYRDKVDKIFNKYTNEDGSIRMPIPEEVPPPGDGDWWGPWRYNANVLELEYYNQKGNHQYGVDLNRCNNSAQVLDWIFQINTKTWCGYECMGQLVQALRDLLHPQANICGGGKDHVFEAATHLRGRQK